MNTTPPLLYWDTDGDIQFTNYSVCITDAEVLMMCRVTDACHIRSDVPGGQRRACELGEGEL